MTEKNKQENAIVAANMQINGSGLVMKSAADLKLIAELFVKSGVVPKCFDSAPKIAVVVEAGAELGFKPWQSIQNFQIVNGQLGLKSTAIGGLIRSSGKCKYMKDCFEGKPGTDGHTAIVTSVRTDDPTEKETRFSLADAKQAGLTGKDSWNKYAEDMLLWRALSRHGRRYYGDVLCGFYTEEELRAIEPPDSQATPEVPSRGERKPAEGVTVKDSREVIAAELEAFVGKLSKAIETEKQYVLHPEDDAELTKTVLAKYAEVALEDTETDYTELSNYTVEKIKAMSEALDLGILPDDVLDLVPDPFATGKDETPELFKEEE